MEEMREYLLSYGNAGDFGRFHPVKPLTCGRGDRAVIRSARGLELGTVLCRATTGLAHYLPNTSVGQLLRLASREDEQTAERMRNRSQEVFDHGRELASALALPLEILDVEVLLDGQQAVVHHIRYQECDVRPFVSGLSKRHQVQIALHDLTKTAADEEGCGRPDCGRGKGGCGSCGEGGGCSTCGSHGPSDLQAYFAQLREQMMDHNRTPLL
jgi:cell fate regulator YaaT (PSP1 superfamily)